MKKSFRFYYLGLILFIIALAIPTFISASVEGENRFDILKGKSHHFNIGSNETGEEVQAANKTDTMGIYSFVNRCQGNLFVGNRTPQEFLSFISGPPPCVEKNECGDGVCQASTENIYNCRDDCFRPSGGCGDGICQTVSGVQVKVYYNPPQETTYWEKVCRVKQSRWLWVPVVSLVLVLTGNDANVVCDDVRKITKVYSGYVDGGEAYTVSDITKQVECKQDCSPPSTTGCGVCGYNASGQVCPNYCGDRGNNLVNCSFHPARTVTECPNTVPPLVKNNDNLLLKKYFGISSALASIEQDCITYTYEAYWGCDNSDDASLCPAGYYCTNAGGLRTSFCPSGQTCQQITCPAGSYCPKGSSYPRYCAYNYYSDAGASLCTKCPTGTGTVTPGTAGLANCIPLNISQDGVCGPEENPGNSPQDCPDNFSDSRQAEWIGDGLCTGIETLANSLDCSCGNGVCDTYESDLLCISDCACLDNVCNTGETNKCTVGGNIRTNPGCATLADADRCGDGVCSLGESYNETLGKIVCKTDCFCGNSICESAKGETMSSCFRDCTCGNDICDGTDTRYNCLEDCSCGNGTCEPQYGEHWSNCSNDCHCGNHICESQYGETPSNCYLDCSTCGNGICEYRETAIKPVPSGKVYCYNDCHGNEGELCTPDHPCAIE